MKSKLFLIAILVSFSVTAQKKKAKMESSTSDYDISIPVESAIETQNTVTIKGKSIAYTAKAGTQPVWDEDGKVIATLFYTYYTRNGIQNRDDRPLFISFNGGPGSGSLWMHMAYTGPKILKIDDEGHPIQPYGVRDNPYSILDVADIVFVNPVNTGLSRIVNKDTPKKTFFGVKADIKYLASWVNTFVGENNRWNSPKYLIGESYGTTRVSGLALELQERHWMFFNGVVLVSPTGLGIKRDGPVSYANKLPYYTAAAWFHKKLPSALQSKDLDDILPEAEDFAINSLIPALSMGGYLDSGKREAIAEKISYYSGISKKNILQHNLVVPTSFFWKELMREEGYTIGRLDSRYLGVDKMEAGIRYDYPPELISWEHSFAPAINYYIKNILKFETKVKYNLFGPVRPWDRSGDNTGDNLRKAMAENPYLHVMIQSGYYDGATNYFDAKYTMWNMDRSGRLKDRLEFKGYRSGHMMYLRREDLQSSNEHIREFIKKSYKSGGVAKY